MLDKHGKFPLTLYLFFFHLRILYHLKKKKECWFPFRVAQLAARTNHADAKRNKYRAEMSCTDPACAFRIRTPVLHLMRSPAHNLQRIARRGEGRKRKIRNSPEIGRRAVAPLHRQGACGYDVTAGYRTLGLLMWPTLPPFSRIPSAVTVKRTTARPGAWPK